MARETQVGFKSIPRHSKDRTDRSVYFTRRRLTPAGSNGPWFTPFPNFGESLIGFLVSGLITTGQSRSRPPTSVCLDGFYASMIRNHYRSLASQRKWPKETKASIRRGILRYVHRAPALVIAAICLSRFGSATSEFQSQSNMWGNWSLIAWHAKRGRDVRESKAGLDWKVSWNSVKTMNQRFFWK